MFTNILILSLDILIYLVALALNLVEFSEAVSILSPFCLQYKFCHFPARKCYLKILLKSSEFYMDLVHPHRASVEPSTGTWGYIYLTS